MFEKLKKYLKDYSKEIDKQPPQEYDKSLRDLWEKNGALAAKTLIPLNARYISLNRIKDIPEEHRGTHKDRVNCVRNSLALVIPGYSLDALKSILSEDYSPPEEIEDALQHLLTLHYFYAYLMPTTPGLSHIIPLKAGYALAKLVSSALAKSFVIDGEGNKGDSKLVMDGARKKTADKKRDAAILAFWQISDRKEKKWAGIKQAVEETLMARGLLPQHKHKHDEKQPDHRKQIQRYLLSDPAIKEMWEKKWRK